MKYVLLLVLALVLGVVASGHHRARVRRPAPAALAAPVVVRKPAWAAGRPKTVRAVRPGPQPRP